MLVQDILGASLPVTYQEIQLVQENCSQYLQESAGFPLLKALPTSYANFQRVKVRMQKHKDALNEAFDKAFGDECYNLRQRAIFARSSIDTLKEGFEQFYVFPTNGYRFLYSTTVSDSNADYMQVIEKLIEQLDDPTQATELVGDVIKMTYSSQNLAEGISSNAEVIFHSVPFYYAIRASIVQDYKQLFYN